MSTEKPLTEAEREELIEALQYPTKWLDKGMPTEQVVERATDGHEAAQVVDEYLLPVISRILAARCAELEALVKDSMSDTAVARGKALDPIIENSALQATLDRVTAENRRLTERLRAMEAEAEGKPLT